MTPKKYEELRDFLMPDHRWLYFFIRCIRTNGWIYFMMSMLPALGTFYMNEQPKTIETTFGAWCLALAAGFISLKAYRSQSPKDQEKEENEKQVDTKTRSESLL